MTVMGHIRIAVVAEFELAIPLLLLFLMIPLPRLFLPRLSPARSRAGVILAVTISVSHPAELWRETSGFLQLLATPLRPNGFGRKHQWGARGIEKRCCVSSRGASPVPLASCPVALATPC